MNICHLTIENTITHSSQTYSTPETTIPNGHYRFETPKSLITPTHDPLQGRGKNDFRMFIRVIDSFIDFLYITLSKKLLIFYIVKFMDSITYYALCMGMLRNRCKLLRHGIVVTLIPLCALAAKDTQHSFYDAVSHALNKANIIETLRNQGTYIVLPFSLERDKETKCTVVTRHVAQAIEFTLTENGIPVYPLLAQERMSLEDTCNQVLPKDLVLPPNVSSVITGTLRPQGDQAALILRITDREGREKIRSLIRLEQGAELGPSLSAEPARPASIAPDVQQGAQSEKPPLRKRVHELMQSADKTLLAAQAVRYLQEAKALIGDHAGFDKELHEIQEKLRKHQNTLEMLRSDDYDF
jgi:hypothetical protein